MSSRRLISSTVALLFLAGAVAGLASAAPWATVAPTVTLTAQPPATTSATSLTISWTSSGATTTTCSRDSTAAYACTSPVTLTGLSIGSHTFAIRVANTAGSNHAVATWTNTTATSTLPSATINSGPANPTTATSATFAFSTANATSVSCSLDTAAATACAGSIAYSSLTVGTHTFHVTAASGALAATTTLSWTVIPTGSTAGANAWVDANGGTCAYASTPAAYNDATACATFQKALAALPATGGTILVKCGIYPPQVLSSRNKTGMATIASETNRCATIEAHGAIALTVGTGVSYVTLDSLTINGMIRGSTMTGAGNNDVTISHDDINVGKKVDGPSVTFFVGDYVSLVSNTIGPTCCGYNAGKGVSPEGIRIGKPNLAPSSCSTQVCHLLIDDNLIQNVVRDCALYPSASFGACPDTSCSNAVGCHEDGINIWGVDGGTISRNRLYGVECQAIFLENTNGSLNRNVSIVNNAISSVLGGCGNKGIYLKASGTTDGATTGFAGTWTIAFNSGAGQLIGPNGCGSCWPGTTFQLVGNDMPLFATNATGNGAGCTTPWGPSTVTYQYDIWRSGGINTACGATDLLANPAFVNQVNAPMVGDDFHLGATGAADNFVPAAVCDAITTQDMDGAARPVTGYCDAGADDR